MNKKIHLLTVLLLVASLFLTSTGTVFAKVDDPYSECQAGKPPSIPVPVPGIPGSGVTQLDDFGKEIPPGPRCEFSQPIDDLLPDLGTCELKTNTLIDFGLPQTVRSVAALYEGDLPFPRNGMPLLALPTGVEYFPEGSTGNLSVCFVIPEGRSGNISFWDISSVPNAETELPTFVRNGVACAVATKTGVYGLVEDLPF